MRVRVTYQHVSVLDVEVEEEEEGDEEAEEGDGGAFPQTPHLIQGFPHQPHAARALSGTCGRSTTTTGEVRRWSDLLPVSQVILTFLLLLCVN